MNGAFQIRERKDSIKIKILYFANVREILGGKRYEEMRIADQSRVRDLLSMIAKAYPNINPLLMSISISVNYRIVNRDTLLHDNDEIALIPPITGG